MISNFFGVGRENISLFLICYTCFIAIHILVLFALKKNWKYGILFWLQYQFIVLVHAIIWFPIPTRIHLLAYFLMFWLWMSHYDQHTSKGSIKILEISLISLIIITIPNTYKIAYDDILYRHSDGKEAAKFITNNLPKNSVLININTDYSQLIAGYLNKENYKIYMPNQERFITFCTWDKKYTNKMNLYSITKAIKKLDRDYEHLYILVPNTIRIRSFILENLKNYLELRKIYATDATTLMKNRNVFDLTYFEIYEIVN